MISLIDHVFKVTNILDALVPQDAVELIGFFSSGRLI